MNVLLINPPYQTFTSNVGVGHQVPLGLLMIGGALIDAGCRVRLLDAECRRLSVRAVAREVRRLGPDVVMTGHAGSTPAHPVCIEMLREIKAAAPQIQTVYGGVYPTYHAGPIIESEPAVDFIVRGEGEATSVELLRALRAGATPTALADVAGIAFRDGQRVVVARDRPPIRHLDTFRTGWELIHRWDDYQCFGLGRAAIVQFSRGCPHRCTYCGQHGFWVNWRHRDPLRLVDEIEMLHRRHGVRFITLADENPTTLRPVWQQFLEDLARRKLDVHFFATIRATDIVRDADLLPLYRRAGILYVLMGIESTRDDVLVQVRKRSTTRHDLEACRLLRENGIFSVLGQIVGLADETRQTFRAARRQLRGYQGDWLNAMYVTPHDWTAFGVEMAGRVVVEPGLRRWDYRHQVLAQRHMTRRQIFFAVKWMELLFHLRRFPALLTTRNRFARRQLWWTLMHVGLVWAAEFLEFLVRPAPRIRKPSLRVSPETDSAPQTEPDANMDTPASPRSQHRASPPAPASDSIPPPPGSAGAAPHCGRR
jgi:anaerobic magnesium-protoporphyrin IX monomethyl ester cyclase